MALRTKSDSQAIASPAEQVAADQDQAYSSWLEKVRDHFRKACQSDARLVVGAEAKAMARGIAASLSEEPNGPKRFALLVKLVRERAPSEEEQSAAATLFRRRQAARDALASRLGKPDDQDWDSFYHQNYGRKRIPYVAELMVEIGAIAAPPRGVRPSQRKPMDDPRRMADAEANATAWIGEPATERTRADLA